MEQLLAATRNPIEPGKRTGYTKALSTASSEGGEIRINKEKGVDFVELMAPTFIMIKPGRSVYCLCKNIHLVERDVVGSGQPREDPQQAEQVA